MAKTTMNEQELLMREWIFEMQDAFTELAGSPPLIVEGIQPMLDMQVIDCASVKNIWFWYPKEEYSLIYWRKLLKQVDPTDTRIHVSTAEELSANIGIPILHRNIPDAWVVSMEKLS